ncbi:predicted protein [Nematostella vectensis]|uniref:Acetylserotonin O-methyltransferase n=1 Tax=Nematostella vectensis TaxID=45351 RepID=A7RRZ2_NEMVE|nr:predicted protein [Nematostella vectensis]|eukprot:XP_001637723.1 predicted protein [Nematostella vectensis]
MFGFCGSQTLFTACELGIFDLLHASNTPLSANAIAKDLSTDVDATGRLLDALVCLELLEKTPASPPVYMNTPTTDRFLLQSSPNSVKPCMQFGGTVLYRLFSNLTSAVRDGNNQWGRTFNGSTAGDFFKSAYATREGVIRVLEGMRGTSRPVAPLVVTAFDLSSFATMCDVGGGTGDLAYAASNAYPDMAITVLDLPPVVQCSPHFRPSMEECPRQENVTFVPGDFFRDELPPADLYVLTHTIHDWGEDKIEMLLSKVFRSLQPGGGLLIGEILLSDRKTGPFQGVMASLTMLVLCDKGARERSEQEYRDILERHGFIDIQAKRTGTAFMDAILCRKP